MEFYNPYKEELSQEEEAMYAALAKEGDGEAMLRLVGSVSKWIHHIIHGMSRPPAISDQDIFDEISSDLLLSCQKFDPEIARFVTFITRIVKGKARDAINRLSSSVLRPRSRSPKDSSEPEVVPITNLDFDGAIESDDDIFYHMHIDELFLIVNSIVGERDSFRQHWKQILELRMAGRSVVECAKILGVPRKSIEVSIASMRSHVAKELAKRETDCSIWTSKQVTTNEQVTMWD